MDIWKEAVIMIQTDKGRVFQWILATAILAFVSLLISRVMWEGAFYGSGNDIWGHLFKTEVMYQGLQNGTSYPLYTPYWYNGIQLYRYWPPLSYYVLAGLRFLTQGDMQIAYYLYFALSAFLGGLPWIALGVRTRRPFLGLIIALLWFFMPDNIRVFLNEGNLPRMLAITLIPYLIFFLWLYLREKKSPALLGLILISALMVLAHVMIAAMSGIAVFVFLVFDSLRRREYICRLRVLLAMLSGIMLTGLWLIPALSGGLVSMNASSTAVVMQALAFRFADQLDPLARLADSGPFYFGLSVVILSLFGGVFAPKGGRAGYYFVLLLVIAITPAFIPILLQFPASELFWMIRFTTFAYAFFFFSMMEWQKLRRWACIFFVIVLCLDCIPSLSFGRYAVDHSRTLAHELSTIKGITKQRTAIMDLSVFGSYPSWALCTGDDAVSYTYGWAWQGAETASNIVLLNTALEAENYLYLFDRSLEMGNDTVAIHAESVGKNLRTEKDLISEAAMTGYRLVRKTDKMYIFHVDTPPEFGLITDYEGIAIGAFADTVPLYFPSFSVGTSDILDDYKIEDFEGYETVFLSGFDFQDQGTAEDLVRTLADRGIKVVIDVTHVPFDPVTQRMNFLDVYVSGISFVNRFPDMYYGDEKILAGPFPEEYTTWNTQYLVEMDHIKGYADYSGERLIWAGYNEDPNILFLGFNLVFHAIDAEDYEIFKLLSSLLDVPYQKLPHRQLVPLDIEHSDNGMRIRSDYSGVNTTLAWQDIFETTSELGNENNLMVVRQGVTDIRFTYPLGKPGFRVSLAGLLASLMILLHEGLSKRRNRKKASASGNSGSDLPQNKV
jgi:uncharacterized membrane protein